MMGSATEGGDSPPNYWDILAKLMVTCTYPPLIFALRHLSPPNLSSGGPSDLYTLFLFMHSLIELAIFKCFPHHVAGIWESFCSQFRAL